MKTMNSFQKNITDFFGEMLSDLKCQADTKAYIIGIYGKYKSPEFDLSKDSVGLMFLQARTKQDFSIYQNLGDWIWFASTISPSHLRFASKDYYDNIAQLSYYSCYKIINKKWKLFEELSDNFVELEEQARKKLGGILK